jgi:hypothetical protein
MRALSLAPNPRIEILGYVLVAADKTESILKDGRGFGTKGPPSPKRART